MGKKNSWKKMYEEMKDVAGEALYLADAYAGGDSDTEKELSERFDNITALEEELD
jgi:hypothetical protein